MLYFDLSIKTFPFALQINAYLHFYSIHTYIVSFYLDHLNKPRLILSENGDGKTYTQQPFKYTQKLDSDRPFCSTFTLTVAVRRLFQNENQMIMKSQILIIMIH